MKTFLTFVAPLAAIGLVRGDMENALESTMVLGRFTMVLGGSTMVLGRSTMVLGRSTMVLVRSTIGMNNKHAKNSLPIRLKKEKTDKGSIRLHRVG